VNPVLSKDMCFESDGPTSLESLLPVLTPFTQLPGTYVVHGKQANAFNYVVTNGDKVNNYTFFF
jgi:hypothetical protein